MKQLGALLIFVAAAFEGFAQAPNLSEGVELWRGKIDDREMRIVQIPRRATALIPLRFVLEEISARHAHPDHVPSNCPDCAVSRRESAVIPRPEGLDRFDYGEFSPVSGAEALLSYAPARRQLHQWGNAIAEARETFRSPGSYEVIFGSSLEPELRLGVTVNVAPFQYLEFSEEFGFFVLGCVVLGFMMIGIIVWLHRRSPRNSVA